MDKIAAIPPEIIDALYGLAMAIIGWLVRKLQTKKKDKALLEQNDKLTQIITYYDQAAKDSLRFARKPRPHESPGTEGDNSP